MNEEAASPVAAVNPSGGRDCSKSCESRCIADVASEPLRSPPCWSLPFRVAILMGVEGRSRRYSLSTLDQDQLRPKIQGGGDGASLEERSDKAAGD